MTRHRLRFHRNAKLLAELFAWLRDKLALHFALEEARGIFQDAAAHQSRLTETADVWPLSQ